MSIWCCACRSIFWDIQALTHSHILITPHTFTKEPSLPQTSKSEISPPKCCHCFWGPWKWSQSFSGQYVTLLIPSYSYSQQEPGINWASPDHTNKKAPLSSGPRFCFSKWCLNTYMYHLLWHPPAMREKKTLWESHKAGHSLHRCSVLSDFRTPGGKQWLSQWVQEKTSRTPVQRAPSLHGCSPKHICMEKYKRLYQKGKCSPEDNPRSHTVCNWHCHFWIPVRIKCQVA